MQATRHSYQFGPTTQRATKDKALVRVPFVRLDALDMPACEAHAVGQQHPLSIVNGYSMPA